MFSTFTTMNNLAYSQMCAHPLQTPLFQETQENMNRFAGATQQFTPITTQHRSAYLMVVNSPAKSRCLAQ